MKLWLCLVLLLLCSTLVLSHAPKRHDNGPSSPERPHEDTTPTYEPTYVPTEGPTDTPAPTSDNEPTDEPRMCTMNIIMCPNGEMATKDKYCRQICGGAPMGYPSFSTVMTAISSFKAAYGASTFKSVQTSTLYQIPNVKYYYPESSYDNCIKASLMDPAGASLMPDVWNGVRVFYIQDDIACSPKLCSDGTVVGCNEFCPPVVQVEEGGTAIFPMTLIFLLIVLFSFCCCFCCAKQRRRCNQKENSLNLQVVVPYTETSNSSFSPSFSSSSPSFSSSSNYPSEQYELLVNQQEQQPPVYPVMSPMMFPMHPQMVLPQNGTYPVMMQAPNGMWYLVPNHENV